MARGRGCFGGRRREAFHVDGSWVLSGVAGPTEQLGQLVCLFLLSEASCSSWISSSTSSIQHRDFNLTQLFLSRQQGDNLLTIYPLEWAEDELAALTEIFTVLTFLLCLLSLLFFSNAEEDWWSLSLPCPPNLPVLSIPVFIPCDIAELFLPWPRGHMNNTFRKGLFYYQKIYMFISICIDPCYPRATTLHCQRNDDKGRLWLEPQWSGLAIHCYKSYSHRHFVNMFSLLVPL